MFFRKKKNKSGVISVQIIDKSTGRYKLIKTIGSSADSCVIDTLVLQANVLLPQSKETKLMLLDKTDEQKSILKLFE